MVADMTRLDLSFFTASDLLACVPAATAKTTELVACNTLAAAVRAAAAMEKAKPGTTWWLTRMSRCALSYFAWPRLGSRASRWVDGGTGKLIGMISLHNLLLASVRYLNEERQRERVLRIRLPSVSRDQIRSN